MAGMQETDRLTMKNGITYLLQDAKARAQLAELLAEVMEKYGAGNPPPYPVTSVNGQTGDVDIPTVDLPVSVQNGGTGATTAAQAAKNLGVLPLGEVVTKIPENADLNDYDLPGVYAIESSSTAATIANMPQRTAGILRVFSSTGSNIKASSTWKSLIQEYIVYTGARYQRRGGSGSGTAVTWGAWETIYTSAYFESGAGYCKMPDGTLICYGIRSNVASGATINFPSPFVGRPVVVVTPNYNTGTTIRCTFSVEGVTVSSATVYAWDTITNALSASTTLTFYWQAIGRWK